MEKRYIIYKYTSPSGGVYIGQTHNTIEERAGKGGYYYMVLNKKTGKFLQPAIGNAILKYGWDNFQKEILFENLSSEEADEKEKELISIYSSGISYNTNSGGKLTIENKHERKIKQYTLNGEYIKTWDSIKEAEKFVNVKYAQANIVSCCQGKKKRAYGYIWKYEDDNTKITPLKPYRTSICQFSKDDEYIATFSTIKEASDHLGVKENGIGNVLHGRAKTAGGYKWKFLSECESEF